ncbi:hypothetical protein [Halostella salina]|uniref:hypothetical protein n=1 Tax=Halostella salina TaxID=1547897 RepID=UPI000EF84841|nr:hypothetical protein [Halostella salina]
MTDDGEPDAAADPDDPLSGLVDDLPDPAVTGDADGEPAGGTDAADHAEADASADDPPDREPVDDAPLGDLAARIDERRTERASATESELFTEQSAESIDSDRLWEQVTGADDATPPDDAGNAPQRDERVVSKRSYCQGCEHFSAPPDVRCDHAGTEILEVVDLDRFRVVDCPVVREEELLDDVGDARDDA